MKKLRILHVQETLGPGGVERRRLSLSKKMDKSKFEQKIICTQIQFTLVEKIREQDVEVIPIGFLKNPFHWSQHKKVQKIIDAYKPHIIHGAVFEGVSMAAINGFLKRVPVVIIEETSDPTNRSWKANLLMWMFGKLSDCAIGTSPAAVTYLKEVAKINQHKIRLINNGVMIPRKVAAREIINLKKSLGIKNHETVIGSVGRMIQDENKRFSDLIKAFALLSKNNSHLKLLLVGSGREQENYKLLTQELEISDKVIFTDYQEDTAKYYAIMDVFSLVSAQEGFGLVIAEAMLHKLAVVATRVGGMQYVVEDNKTGYLVERYKVDEIAKKLDLLINNEPLRKEFGNAGYERAMQNYTEDIYVKNVETLYLELAKAKNLI